MTESYLGVSKAESKILSKVDKLIAALEYIVDDIIIEDNKVMIKTKKDIIIVNEGNSLIINSGVSVNISKEIHLNPNIDTSNIFEDMNKLEDSLEVAKKIEIEKVKNKIKEWFTSKWKIFGSLASF